MYLAQHAKVITEEQGAYDSRLYRDYGRPLHQQGIVELKGRYKQHVRRYIRQPSAVLIAAHHSPLLHQRHTLSTLGFKVVASHSLLDGYTQTLQLLALPKYSLPTVVLLDIFSIQPGFPELPGSLVAAVLARHMSLKEINTAWLVGFADTPDPQHETEALIAGCHHVLSGSLSDGTLHWLQDLALRPAPIPHIDACPEQVRIIRVLQHIAVRVLQSVRAAYVETWTPEDVALVLSWLTRYPVRRSRSEGKPAISSSDVHHLVRALGGFRAAHERLRTIADQWQERYPVHAQVLHKFLDGYERREIVHYFVKQGLYEDTRIYTCIRELPQRLSEQLRLDQAVADIDQIEK